ncbi:hypothetical protein DY000_02035532 [Brassica cretica]|uniref:Secreted protein n=1 Tax=Brassica cretica TaxID=69181 RepID=A0ABQ7DLZ7_BRACR|nr:hypothetical protein DY000_02035532 [Brassica cretica]
MNLTPLRHLAAWACVPVLDGSLVSPITSYLLLLLRVLICYLSTDVEFCLSWKVLCSREMSAPMATLSLLAYSVARGCSQVLGLRQRSICNLGLLWFSSRMWGGGKACLFSLGLAVVFAGPCCGCVKCAMVFSFSTVASPESKYAGGDAPPGYKTPLSDFRPCLRRRPSFSNFKGWPGSSSFICLYYTGDMNLTVQIKVTRLKVKEWWCFPPGLCSVTSGSGECTVRFCTSRVSVLVQIPLLDKIIDIQLLWIRYGSPDIR